MCGFAGTVGVEDRGRLASQLAAAMKRRGPDGSGEWCDSSGRFALAHRRLAIIDLDERSAQPMLDRSGRYAISFNGEIYNYKELRAELEKDHGCAFVTEGDSEVILTGFGVWGDGVFARLNGMFAIALVDTLEREVVLCRDRLGVKPLYYASRNGMTCFSSEMGAILSEVPGAWTIKADSVTDYLWLGYVRSPETIVEGILKVPAGTSVRVSEDSISDPSIYWDVEKAYEQPLFDDDFAGITDRLETLLTESIRYRLVSDVPVGLFLSGGLDSTLLATLLVRNLGVSTKAYTLAVDSAQHDESGIARETAQTLGIDHAVGTLQEQDLLSDFDLLPQVFDEPLADTSCIPTLSISRFVAQERKVVLSADGADEVFAGYRRYQWATRVASARRVLPRRILRAVTSFGTGRNRYLRKLADVFDDESCLLGYLEWNAIQSVGQAKRLSCNNGEPAAKSATRFRRNAQYLSAIQHLDLVEYLPDDILVKVDRATMHFGLEGREPFLDYRLVEFAARCPADAMIDRGKGKVMMREILRKHGMHHVLGVSKRGFSVPVKKWLGAGWTPLVNSYLSPNSVSKYDWLDSDTTAKLRLAFDKGDATAASPIYALLVVLRWAEYWNVK